MLGTTNRMFFGRGPTTAWRRVVVMTPPPPRNLSSTTITTMTQRGRHHQVMNMPLQLFGVRHRMAPPVRQNRLSFVVNHNNKPNSHNNKRFKATLANDMAAKSSGGYVSKGRTAQNSWVQYLEASLRKTRTIPVPRWITPRHYTTTISECLGHSSFLLVAISYAVDDFLMLRCIAVAGSTAMLFFTYYQ